jgi:hypothetical protein
MIKLELRVIGAIFEKCSNILVIPNVLSPNGGLGAFLSME